MQINWTGIIGSIIIALTFLVVGWLTPSPFDKKQGPTDVVAIDYIVGQEDSTFVSPEPIIVKDTTEQKKPTIITTKVPEDTLNPLQDIFVFEKMTQDTSKDGTIYAFRSTTYFNPIDSSSFTIHEINLEPRSLEVIHRVDTLKVVEIQYIQREESITDSKYVWGAIGIIVGILSAGLAIKKEGK